MEKKLAVYLCSGCGIGEAIRVDSLAKLASGELKAPICRTSGQLCGPEGAAQLQRDIAEEGVNCLVLAACSPRVSWPAFSFDPRRIVSERVNLREQVAWSHEPRPREGEQLDEDIQALAEDQLRMGIARARLMETAEPSVEGRDKRVLVLGGGVTGLSAALNVAAAGYEAVLVEREEQLGGFARRLHLGYPRSAPYTELAPSPIAALVEETESCPRIEIHRSATIQSISGAPGMFKARILRQGKTVEEGAGAIILAAGFEPYDPRGLEELGYGRLSAVVTSVAFEELAARGELARPSDGGPLGSVAFIQCAGSRDERHLAYCSSICCMNSLKQALYVRERYPDAKIYIIYKDMRTPGQYEHFYQRAQEDEGIFFAQGEVRAVGQCEDGRALVELDSVLHRERIGLAADLVVLATGMVPRTALGEGPGADGSEGPSKGEPAPATANLPSDIVRSGTLNLDYRQGPELPSLKYGFPDSHFICFPYESRRTGIFAAGSVRQPMDMAACMRDARGAALKAIQCVEMVSEGKALHPRSGDLASPKLFMQRCTQCKRCTEECPFGMYDDDGRGNPVPNPTRCRRCGICMGSCPERIISFEDFSVAMVGAMIKAIEVPEEETLRILVFACENDAYPALDMVGLRRGRYNPFVRIVPLRCIGSLNLVWIADALSKGIDGILLLGCKHGEDYQCHFIQGSALANERLGKIKETLDRLMLEPERVRIEQVEIDDCDRIPAILDGFLETIEAIGPNPYKGV
ncbi:MAG: hydrogenase iron-sulfur subunit [Polyangia bacterium]|jgi:quinone-modifying oxidoreductase subunit QmoB|nr:hydrogenase iron-sulfur subunit [Polyangia bacterium]